MILWPLHQILAQKIGAIWAASPTSTSAGASTNLITSLDAQNHNTPPVVALTRSPIPSPPPRSTSKRTGSQENEEFILPLVSYFDEEQVETSFAKAGITFYIETYPSYDMT